MSSLTAGAEALLRQDCTGTEPLGGSLLSLPCVAADTSQEEVDFQNQMSRACGGLRELRSSASIQMLRFVVVVPLFL